MTMSEAVSDVAPVPMRTCWVPDAGPASPTSRTGTLESDPSDVRSAPTSPFRRRHRLVVQGGGVGRRAGCQPRTEEQCHRPGSGTRRPPPPSLDCHRFPAPSVASCSFSSASHLHATPAAVPGVARTGGGVFISIESMPHGRNPWRWTIPAWAVGAGPKMTPAALKRNIRQLCLGATVSSMRYPVQGSEQVFATMSGGRAGRGDVTPRP